MESKDVEENVDKIVVMINGEIFGGGIHNTGRCVHKKCSGIKGSMIKACKRAEPV